MSTEELKPCAHCGSAAQIKRGKTVMVSCTNCTASTFQTLGDEQSAITAWNRRATLAPSSEPVAWRRVGWISDAWMFTAHQPTEEIAWEPLYTHPASSEAQAGQQAQAAAQAVPEGLRNAVYMALHYYMKVQNPNEWEATDKAIEAMLPYFSAAPKVPAQAGTPTQPENT